MKLRQIFTALAAAVTLCAAAETPEHVILIGLDGWGAYSMPKADMPTVKKLMDEGAWTMKKRSVLPSSSAINWASIFMGVGTEGHGYTNWDSKTPEIPSIAVSEHGIFPTIFTVAREQMPDADLAVFYEWDGIRHLVDTLALTTHRNIEPIDGKDSSPITTAVANYIKEKRPKILAVHYDNPDHVGHNDGHDTPAYYDIMTYMDKQIAALVKAVEDAGILDSTLIVITSDHGGKEYSHGGKSMMEMETPLIFKGPGIKNVGELKSAIMQTDIAPSIAKLLGLEVPQAWSGRPVEEAIK